MRWFFPLKSLLTAGIPVAGGTDHMMGHGKDNAVNPYNPFLNIWSCVTRKTREGETFYPEEKISREECLADVHDRRRLDSVGGEHRGSLEIGKYADLVVIDRDFMNLPRLS